MKTKIIGCNNRVLFIDLTDGSVNEFQITNEDRKNFLGGKGLALKFLAENMNIHADPLSPENMLAFFTGVMLGTGAPCSARFSAVSKSPLTGIFTSSSCGGPFGYALKTAGYDGIIITGKAKKPTYIRITPDKVEFCDATELWGRDTVETQEELYEANCGILAIGPAGENKVRYANIASGHRFLGRGGLGAVMGAKNLKAIVAVGEKFKIIPAEPKKFKNIRNKGLKLIRKSKFTNYYYKKFGTNTNIRLSNKGGILPVRNFSKGQSDDAELIAGETIAAYHKTRPHGCRFCPIQCGHKGEYGEYGTLQVPEYETNSLFGANLEIYDRTAIAEFNDICNRMGLDTMSTAVTLAYIMEAGEKGYIKTFLKFGSKTGISDMLYKIAYRKGFGDDVANGSKWLAEKYGGKEFAIQVKGLEMAGYDPRGAWGQGLSYSVANRGACHLASTIFVVENYFEFLDKHSTKGKAEFVWYFENLYNAINSLQLCIFEIYAFGMEQLIIRLTPKLLLRLVMKYFPKLAIKLIDMSIYSKFFEAVTGIKLNLKQFLKAGERISVLERYLNTRLGVTSKDDTLPKRFLTEGRETDPQKHVVPLKEMLVRYYRIRGYDQNGIPTNKLLKKLDLERLLSKKIFYNSNNSIK